MSAGGILFIVAAPSGAGKTSLVQALLESDAEISVSVSHTTRRRRSGETAGVNYHFVHPAVFDAMIDDDAFLEHAEVHGNRYGTSKTAVDAALANGSDVILEIDWQGAALVRKEQPAAVSVFIVPPSLEALRARLQQRAQDDAQVIESRLAAAHGEMRHHGEFDYLVINDDFDTALGELKAIVLAERCRQPRRSALLADLLKGLLSG